MFARRKTNWEFLLIILLLAGIAGGEILISAKEEIPLLELPPLFKNNNSNYIMTNQEFRNLTAAFVKNSAYSFFNNEEIKEEKLEIKGDWRIEISVFLKGEEKGRGLGKGELLTLALEQAVNNALKVANLKKEDLEEATFLIESSEFSLVTYNNQGREVVDDLVVTRSFKKKDLKEKINQGKKFLFRMMDQNEYGFHKRYFALEDNFEERLHTVYSASIIYTLLYLNDLEEDKKILESLNQWGSFLFLMQNLNKTNRYGAFHYSYFLDKKEKEKKFVVGTSALTIFTLLRLNELTDNPEYLRRAKLAGDWLLTMQREDGSMNSYLKYSNGDWFHSRKFSLLYNGQVLSALSKLYRVTNEEKYYQSAKRIAQFFKKKYDQEDGYIKGEYRKKNPISNAWVVMSFMDFYKTKKDKDYKKIIFELSSLILENQIEDENDLINHGRWKGAYSSSGIGWLSEVMADTYRFCLKEGDHCEKYKEAVIEAIRWNLQHTYSKENSFILKNPERAKGGVFWSRNNRYIRTDSVCHSLNGYVRIFNYLDDGLLIKIPEEPYLFLRKENGD